MNRVIIKRIESQIRQQLFGTVMLIVAGSMLVNSFGLVNADADQSNLTFNVTAGAFTIVNVPTAIAFTAQGFGVGNNVLGDTEIDDATVTDYRGNSAVWTVAANANDFKAGTNTIYANKLTFYQDTAGTVTNVVAFDTNQVAIGSNGNIANTGVTLMNASTSGSGIVQFDNGFVNLLVVGTDAVGDYEAIMFFTLS